MTVVALSTTDSELWGPISSYWGLLFIFTSYVGCLCITDKMDNPECCAWVACFCAPTPLVADLFVRVANAH
jgi:hypothetical protein